MAEAIGMLVVVLLVSISAIVTNMITESETRRQCDAFGKTFLNGKVYTCAKSGG